MMKRAIAVLLLCVTACVTACVDEYEPRLGSPCEAAADCPTGLACTHLVDGDVCATKCDSDDVCAALDGTCAWSGVEYPGGAVVESYLCLPR